MRPANPSVRTVLLATDLSDSSLPPLQYATEVAHVYAAKLLLVHVLAPTELEAADSMTCYLRDQAKSAKSELSRIGQSLLAAAGITSEIVVRCGDVRDVLFQVQQEYSADIVVVGSGGKETTFARNHDSIAELAISSMPCSVIAVGPNVAWHPPYGPATTFLFPFDFSATSCSAIPSAISLARDWSAILVLLHVCDHDHFPCTKLEVECSKTLNDVAAFIRNQGVRTRHLIQKGRIAESILASTKEQIVDFIVTDACFESGKSVDRARAQSAVAQLLAKANCPIFSLSRQGLSQKSH